MWYRLSPSCTSREHGGHPLPRHRVNADGSIADVPGWNLNSDGFWVQDPSDAFLREGIFLTYDVNPTAGPVLVTTRPSRQRAPTPTGRSRRADDDHHPAAVPTAHRVH